MYGYLSMYVMAYHITKVSLYNKGINVTGKACIRLIR
jgi:hypothetical protein